MAWAAKNGVMMVLQEFINYAVVTVQVRNNSTKEIAPTTQIK